MAADFEIKKSWELHQRNISNTITSGQNTDQIIFWMKNFLANGGAKAIYDFQDTIQEVFQIYKKGNSKTEIIQILRGTIIKFSTQLKLVKIGGKIKVSIRDKVEFYVFRIPYVKQTHFYTISRAKNSLTKGLTGNMKRNVYVTTIFKMIEYWAKDDWTWAELFADLFVELIISLISLAVATAIAAAVAAGLLSLKITIGGAIISAISLIVCYWIAEGLNALVEKFQIKNSIELVLRKTQNKIQKEGTKAIKIGSEVLDLFEGTYPLVKGDWNKMMTGDYSSPRRFIPDNPKSIVYP